VSREVFLLTEGGKIGTPTDTADAPVDVSTPTFKEKRKIVFEDEPVRWCVRRKEKRRMNTTPS
jgi:hypothetical protein